MSKKYMWLGLVLLVVGILAVAFPSGTYAQQGEGEGNFILVNYLGREIVLDLDDTTYTVPGTAAAPEGGRFTLQLAPGAHKYAVTVPGQGGAAGEFTLSAGEVVGKSVIIEQVGPVVSREGIVLEKPQDEVRVYDFDPSAPAMEQSPPPADTWQPSGPGAGQGSIVWINQGGIDELTIDLEGEIYKVPPQQNGVPGRRQLELPPGTYTYTVSVPNGSLSGQVTVEPGEIIALDLTPVREEVEYEVGEPFKALPPAQLNLSQQQITGQAISPGQAVDQEAPADLPTTGGEVMPPTTEKNQPTGLTVKNYAGDTLTFTINNQAYTIPVDAEQTVPLSPGQYAYTASLPFVATTGIVDLGSDQNVGLSVAINVAHDMLSVYQN